MSGRSLEEGHEFHFPSLQSQCRHFKDEQMTAHLQNLSAGRMDPAVFACHRKSGGRKRWSFPLNTDTPPVIFHLPALRSAWREIEFCDGCSIALVSASREGRMHQCKRYSRTCFQRLASLHPAPRIQHTFARSSIWFPDKPKTIKRTHLLRTRGQNAKAAQSGRVSTFSGRLAMAQRRQTGDLNSR